MRVILVEIDFELILCYKKAGNYVTRNLIRSFKLF